MIILLILSIILLSVGLFLIHQAKKIKVQRTDQINRVNQEIFQKTKELSHLEKENQNYIININNTKEKLEILHNEQDKLNKQLKQKENNINSYYDALKTKGQRSFQDYQLQLCQKYDKTEKQFNSKIQQLNKQQTQVQNQLNQIKKVYAAATAARIREQEDQQKWSFYRIRLTDKQSTDIAKIQKWKQDLYDPTIVSKVIWSAYILKPTSDLCNRVLGSKPVCGIYKITNKATGEVYIGQSVNIAQRWKQHIKCGLGIDASSTNKLYNIMQLTGVWNFTFEVLEECSRDKLNEKERFWIDMYQSNKVGMNLTKGNK